MTNASAAVPHPTKLSIPPRRGRGTVVHMDLNNINHQNATGAAEAFARYEALAHASKRETHANTRDTAHATKETRELIAQLVDHSVRTAEATEARDREAAAAAEKRERQMLRWTRGGVFLSGVAAVAAVLALIVTIALA